MCKTADCTQNSCQNGSTCVERESKPYICMCLPQYTSGPHLQHVAIYLCSKQCNCDMEIFIWFNENNMFIIWQLFNTFLILFSGYRCETLIIKSTTVQNLVVPNQVNWCAFEQEWFVREMSIVFKRELQGLSIGSKLWRGSWLKLQTTSYNSHCSSVVIGFAQLQ